MIKVNLIIITLFIQLSTVLIGQSLDSIGIDNNPDLNLPESKFLNSQLLSVRGIFNFESKKVAYFYGQVGYMQKQDYFKEAKKYWANGNDMAPQLIFLNENEKKTTNGYDAIVVVWYKRMINSKTRENLINELKKAST